MDQIKQTITALHDSWHQVLSFLPDGWQEKCKESGAIKKKLRKFSGPEAILHTLMIHLLGGFSLRQTKALVKIGDIADVSDVAILKRLKRASGWLQWISQKMLGDTAIYPTPHLKQLDMNITVVDATHISEEGNRGKNWRIHYAFDLAQMHCTQAKITDYKHGETLKNFEIVLNTLYIADRGLFQPSGIAHVVNGGADVLVRMPIRGPTLYYP
jgi:hypothetical protein